MTRTETIMMDHENRVRDEFTRQAATFSASPAITDAALTQRFVDALGEAARGSVLDVACGPGISSVLSLLKPRDRWWRSISPRRC
jgi:ubiquinone/menaquinone biosynthesis C-methylase UbiE